tara:strand:- start:1657 stop:2598 length:942 start_codon:yes stop_codon:yes gene_type:complete
MAVTESAERKRKTARGKTSRKQTKSPSRKVAMTKSQVEIKRVSPALGAEILNVDLREDLLDDTIAQIRKALVENSLVLIRDQDITPEQHVAFSRRFGKLEIHVLTEYLLKGHKEILVLSNLKKNSKLFGRAGVGNYWHSDLQYMPKPSLGSILRAHEVPEIGGDTMFANQFLAYDALSDGMKELLAGLRVVHDFAKARYRSPQPYSDKAMKKTRPVTHPAIRTHPESGRKALYVSPGFALRFDGMTEEESEPIFEFLYEHAVDPRFVYRHKWRANDIVFWDNRSLMHNAVQDYDLQKDRRHMHRTTISGDEPF